MDWFGLGGFVFGMIVGRWWAVLGAVTVGIWAALNYTGLDASAKWIGAIFAGMTVVGIAMGVAVRQLAFCQPQD